MQPPHITAWAAKSLAGEPVSVVRVRNLQAVTRAGVDAWGRPGKPQPMLVSAELSFRHQFSQAPAEDRLGADTVNYGTLSKAILRTLENPRPDAEALGLGDVVNQIWLELTGCTVGQNPPAVPEETTAGSPRPLVDLSVLRFMSVTLTLPKASLLGQGVSLTASSVFGLRGPGAGAFVEGYATTLRLIGLRVPTLVGVNANERLAKQVVVADVELDKVNPSSSVYTFIEDRVVKARLLPQHKPAFANRALDDGAVVL